MAVAYKKEPLVGRRVRERWSQLSESDTAQTCSTDPSVNDRAFAQPRELKQVTVHYDSAVTQDVTVTLNSGAGPAYDTVSATISLSNAQDGVFLPEKPVELMGDDVIDVAAPAGGANVKSGITIVTELDES